MKKRKKGDRFIFPALLLSNEKGTDLFSCSTVRHIERQNKSALAPPVRKRGQLYF
jgi:hypothetical protein